MSSRPIEQACDAYHHLMFTLHAVEVDCICPSGIGHKKHKGLGRIQAKADLIGVGINIFPAKLDIANSSR